MSEKIAEKVARLPEGMERYGNDEDYWIKGRHVMFKKITYRYIACWTEKT